MNDILKALKAKCEGAKTLTAAVQEDMAAKVYALAAISEAVAAKAALGFDEVVIEPPTFVDLRRTETAAACVKVLAKAGFEVEWRRRQLRPDDPATWLLVVSWRPKI